MMVIRGIPRNHIIVRKNTNCLSIQKKYNNSKDPRDRQKMNEEMSKNTGKPLETIQLDTERDNFMTAEEAKEYGIVDEIIPPRR